MKVTFLGTAGGEAIPALWCRCASCALARQRGGHDIRCRSAILINDDLLIDAGPDLCASAAYLGVDLATVQALLITHPHSDHLSMDPFMRRGSVWGEKPLPMLTLYATSITLAKLRHPEGHELALAPLHMQAARITVGTYLTIETGGAIPADARRAASPGDVGMLPARRYEVWTLPANHAEPADGPADEPLLFVVRQTAGPEVDGREGAPTLFYATDTGTFSAELWGALARLAAAGIRFDAAIVDATLGTADPARIVRDRHLTLAQMMAHHAEMARRGLFTLTARRLATHFGHWCILPHAELSAMIAQEGIEAAYDGLILSL